MLKIGVIGLGNIAQKAYLPVMAGMQDEVEWHLSSRNPEKLKQIGRKFGFQHMHDSVDDLIRSKIDATFVHAATHAHYSLIKELLEKDIPVYVDKPISENILETEELVALAERKGLLFTCGFNRRFAPLVQQLKEIPDKKLILVQKDRVDNVEEVPFALYDLFIHVADTALFLLDDPVQSVHSHIVSENGKLKRVWMVLETEMTTCLATMNYEAGANQEVMEVQGPGGIHRVRDLSEMTILQKGMQQQITFPDWEPTLTKRGFEPLIRQFIEAVRSKGRNPVSAASTLAVHRLCEEVLQNGQNAG